MLPTNEPPPEQQIAGGTDADHLIEEVVTKLHLPVEEQDIPFWRTAFVYASGNLGTGLFFAFSNFVLPIFLQGLLMPTWLIGLLSSTRTFEGALIQPVVGAWSDHTWTRFGRRRPFIVGFLPISAFFLLVTPILAWLLMTSHAAFLGDTHTTTVVLVTISIVIFTVTFNVMYDPYTALLADVIPARRRGKVNGLAQLLLLVGQLALPLLGLVLIPLFGIGPLFPLVAVALLLAFVPTVFGLKEPRRLPGHLGDWQDEAQQAVKAVKHNRALLLFFVAQFFLWSGSNAIAPYLTLYATTAAGLSTQAALALVLSSQIASVLLVYPLGLLSDRVGAKRVFMGGIICLTAAALAGTFTVQHVALFAILLVAGIGNAAQMVSSYPLLTQLAPPNQIGLFTGLNSTVTSIAAPLATLLVGLLIDTFGYRAMFPFVTVMFLAAIPPLFFLHVHEPWTARVRHALTGQRAA